MGFIEQMIDAAISFLSHERDVQVKVLEKSPPGGLHRDSGRKPVRLLHCVRKENDASGRRRYSRRTITDDQLLRGLAGKEYANSALRIIEHNLKVLSAALQDLQEYSQEAILAGMRRSYQALPRECFQMALTAEKLSRQQQQWAQASYEQSDYMPEEKDQTTSRGLKVRTRAEALIAEMLYKYDIPFRYEQVVHIGQYKLIPDFTFLGRDGREFYWEYCGMMENPTYRKRQLWKRDMYEGAGITEWENMIYTYALGESIDMREIEAIIQTKILPRL